MLFNYLGDQGPKGEDGLSGRVNINYMFSKIIVLITVIIF